MILFEYKYVLFFASAIASLFMVALKTSEDFKSANEFVVEREQNQVEDLPPAENLLLATGYRTGSSFLGELFNQNEDVFYVRVINFDNFVIRKNIFLAFRA